MNASNTPNNNTYTVKSGDTLGKIKLHQLGESQRYQEIMALAVVGIIPMAILFIFFQKAFVRGIALSGLKD